MRASFTRRLRYLGLALIAGTVVALTSDTASAQFRRGGGGGVGISIGSGGLYGGSGYGGSGYGWGGNNYGLGNSGYGWGGNNYGWGGYGNRGYGYSGWNSPYYSSGYSGSYGSGSYYAPQYGYSNNYMTGSPTMYSSAGYASAGNGCCDPCSGGMGSAPMMAHSSGNWNGGVVQASGYQSANSNMGLRIVEVTQQSPAQTAGLTQGAIIESVNGQRVHSFSELQTALRSNNNSSSSATNENSTNNSTNNNSANNNSTNASGTVKITIVDQNGQRVTRDVAVRDNMIGVSVVETPVSFSSDSNNNGSVPQQLPNNTTPGTSQDRSFQNGTNPNGTSGSTTNPSRSTPNSTSPSRTTPDSTSPDRSNPSTSPSSPKTDG